MGASARANSKRVKISAKNKLQGDSEFVGQLIFANIYGMIDTPKNPLYHTFLTHMYTLSFGKEDIEYFKGLQIYALILK